MADRHNQSADSNIPDTIHIAVVGSGGIGKSALSVQYVQSLFTEDYDPTIQDNYSKTALIDGNYVDLDILDTAGQDEFTALREQYMKNQDGFLLCFSLASRETFDKVGEFHKQIQVVEVQMERVWLKNTELALHWLNRPNSAKTTQNLLKSTQNGLKLIFKTIHSQFSTFHYLFPHSALKHRLALSNCPQ